MNKERLEFNLQGPTDWSEEPLGIESEAGHDDHGLKQQRVEEVSDQQGDLDEVDRLDLATLDLGDEDERVRPDRHHD